MPRYIYKHPEKEEYVEVTQTMSEEHVFFDFTGLKWKRVFTVPYAAVSSLSSLDPFDTKAHVDKTGEMKGTMGDLFAVSKEMSERRSEKLGHEDPVKRQLFEKYKQDNNCKHYNDRPDKIETKHAIIDFTAPSPKID